MSETERCQSMPTNDRSGTRASRRELQRLEAAASRSADIHGAEQVDAVGAALDLANAYRSRGEYSRARDVQAKLIVALRERSIGDDDPRIFNAVLHYSVTLADLGLLDDARDLGGQVVEAAERQYGSDSETAQLARNNQAVNLRMLGRYEELIELQERSLEAQERRFGADHIETTRAQFVLAHDKALLFDFGSAVGCGRRAVETFCRTCGGDGRETLVAKNNLALHLAESGMNSEARELIGKTIEIARRVLPEEDELRSRIENNLIAIRTVLGEI